MLAESMNTSRVAMQRMGTVFKENVLEAFDAGTEGGLSDFFNHITEAIKDSAPIFKVLGRVLSPVLSGIGVGIQALLQLIRPFTIAIDKITESITKQDSAWWLLTSTLKTLAAIILTPFALLEEMFDSVEKGSVVIDGLNWTLSSTLTILVLLKTATLAWAGGKAAIMGLAGAFAAVKGVLAGILVVSQAIGLTPVGLLIRAAALAGGALGLGSLLEKLGGGSSNNAVTNASMNAVAGINNPTRSVTNTINIEASDPDHVGRVVQDILDVDRVTNMGSL